MKELDEITSTRIRVLAVILGVIVIIHIIVILCIMLPHRKPAEPEGKTGPAAAENTASAPAAGKPVPAAAARW